MLIQFCNFIAEDFKNWVAVAGLIIVIGMAGCLVFHGRFPFGDPSDDNDNHNQ